LWRLFWSRAAYDNDKTNGKHEPRANGDAGRAGDGKRGMMTMSRIFGAPVSPAAGTARRPDAASGQKRKIGVLLVDDHALFRQGLRQLLELEDDIEVIGDASNGAEALAMVRQLQPDVVLMDINMPDVDGITATRNILADRPETSVVILTMYREDDYAFQAVRAGARGYLLKNAGSQDVVRAVRVTSQGASMIDPTLVPSLLREFHRLVNNPTAPKVERLNEREMTLLRMLVDGKSNKEIAAELDLAESTVKNNLSLLFQKLGARDRTQAAVYALARGLLPKPE
jgi:DNA-binding NarL/FixJ family response regulator